MEGRKVLLATAERAISPLFFFFVSRQLARNGGQDGKRLFSGAIPSIRVDEIAKAREDELLKIGTEFP